MSTPMSRAEWRRRKRRKAMIIRITVFAFLGAVLAALVFGCVVAYRELFMHEQLGTVSSAGDQEVLNRMLEISEFSRPGARMAKRDTKGIVIHCTDNPGTSAMEQRNYYNSLKTTKGNHLSVHFIVDLDGKIVQCIPVNEQALASGARNADTLAIEFCYESDTGEPGKFTYASLVKLTASLLARYGLGADCVYRHSDISSFADCTCPKWFEDDQRWNEFITAVMAQAAVLGKKK
ncbi:MAG: N-acetylmuramoyl-L-alanine amidase [Lachnospiraceae bacterium]|nr:N-acetylmuramoyl-L-alanine amidase [Lachnospiraceae bacterium]